eukprot:CAMPEP_0171171918 /NCGR_PEP_ID=MMETSP0790-20130122/9458_1 /TAXON_ID=2925 /ORGANISM="Alexandrium catenella, Strain OF101" /LENGTH=797 /DNA_ID=CAMNT_0011636773 /DNA_START=90 /DNA_END=2483 /DNA_ORIENTATION=-
MPRWTSVGGVLLLLEVVLLALMGVTGFWAVWLQHTQKCRFNDLRQQGEVECGDRLMYLGSETADIVAMVVVMSFGVFLCGAWLLRQAWRHRARIAVRPSRCLAHCQSLRGILAKVASRRTADPEAEAVAKEFERIRLQRARYYLSKVCAILVFATLTSTYYQIVLFMGADQRRSVNQSTWSKAISYLYQDESMPIIFLGSIAVAMDMFPSMVTSRGLDSANTLIFGFWAWRLAVMTGSFYEYNKYWMLASRILQGFVFGNARLNIMLNGFVVLTDIVVQSLHVRDPTSEGLKTWYRELVVFAMVSLTYWTFDQIQLAEAAAFMRATKSDHASRLVYQVLSCMCDAVTRLDEQFCLTESCPRLSTMLFRQGSVPKGTPFTDLMLPEEADRFLRTVARAKASVQSNGAFEEWAEAQSQLPYAGVCHLSMNDAMNSKFKVEVFFSCVPNPNGPESYLIGIQEDQEDREDRQNRQGVPETSPGNMASSDRLAAIPELATRKDTCKSVSSWSESCRSEDEEDLYVWVDAASEFLAVTECSRGVSLLNGANGPCSSLSDWLNPEDTSRIQAWLARTPVVGRTKHVTFHIIEGCSFKCKLEVGDSSQPTTDPPPACSSTARLVRLLLKEGRLVVAKRREDYEVTNAAIKAARAKRSTHPQSEVETPSVDSMDVWVGMQDDTLVVGKVCAHSREDRLMFEAHPSLVNWVDRPADFAAALQRVVDVFDGPESPQRVNCQLGLYTFTEPVGPDIEAPKRFQARVEVVQALWDKSELPLCIRLSRTEGKDAGATPRAAGVLQSASLNL